MSKLTNTQIKNAKKKNKPYSLSDGLGLSLLINPNGTKWWRYRFQFDYKAKMMSLGTYPDVSLANARKRLAEARKMVANRLNPIAEQKPDTELNASSELFMNIVKMFLAHIKDDISIHHYARSEGLLRLYAIPVLKNQPIDMITYKHVRKVIVSLADSGKKESAKKLYGVFNQLFSYAVLRDHCEVNVCRLIEIKPIVANANKRRFPTITNPTQIKVLLESINGVNNSHYATKMGPLFMALTSLRSTNVRHARWEQIDFKNQIMTIAKEEMKIEKRKLHESEDFMLPLSTPSIKLLKKIQQFSGHGKFIFPSNRGDRAMSENSMLVFIRTLGYTKEEFTPHGFRAMFATIANDQSDFSREIIDAQLAHKVGDSVSQVYNRTNYLEKRKDLVQWWSDWLDSIE